MNKGDIVLVRATVRTEYGTGYEDEVVHQPRHSPAEIGNVKSLFRQQHPEPWRGLVVGKSYLVTGIYWLDGYESRGVLAGDYHHLVWMVEPLDGNRYIKLWHCLEEDLEILSPE